MASLLHGTFQGSAELYGRLCSGLAGQSWLSDANISDVFEHWTTPPGEVLPTQVLLLTPAQVLQICLGQQEHSHEQSAAIGKENRDLIIAPINDGTARANSGSHWSVLVMHRCLSERSAEEPKWVCTHFDSLSKRANFRRAQLLANRLFAVRKMLVDIGVCTRQTNGYDCGVHVLVNAELVVRFYLGCYSWLQFRLSKQTWQQQLNAVTTQEINFKTR